MENKQPTKEAVSYLFKKYFQYASKQKFSIFLFISLSISGQSILLTGPLLFGRMLSEIQHNGLSQKNIYIVLIFLGLLLVKDLIFWLLHGPSRILERIVAFKIANHYRKYLLEGILGKDTLWHNEHDSGDTINKIQKATEGLNNFGDNIFQITQTFVRLIGTALALYFYSPLISFVVLSLSILTLRLIYSFDKRLLPQYSKLNVYSNKASANLFDALSNITTVKILNIESIVGNGVLKRYYDSFKVFLANTKLNEWKWFSVNMSFQIISIIPLTCLLLYKIKTHQIIDIGEISTLYLYLSELIFVFFTFGGFYEQMCLYRNGIMNAEVLETAIAETKSLSRKKIDFNSFLEIKDLQFSYTNNKNSSGLKGINFHIKKGQKIAIIGESGSGKTTFLKAIHGLFSTAIASICIDNQSFFQVNLSHINLSTMLVPQEPEIFSSTILENITLGGDYPNHEIQNAIDAARFSQVLANLPKGLDSIVNEKGVNLSGGQKQRLALARAILFATHKKIILLDESTSSVDPENEIAIYKNIFSLFESKTFIASIHKMNLLQLFDYIVIMGENRILDEGTFQELLRKNLNFKNLWEQFSNTADVSLLLI